MLSNFSFSWFHPFEKYSGGFTLICFDIQFNIKHFFNLRIILLGFGFSLWYTKQTEDNYKPLLVELSVYQAIREMTKYDHRLVPDGGYELIGDYNRIYMYTNSESYILQPKK